MMLVCLYVTQQPKPSYTTAYTKYHNSFPNSRPSMTLNPKLARPSII